MTIPLAMQATSGKRIAVFLGFSPIAAADGVTFRSTMTVMDSSIPASCRGAAGTFKKIAERMTGMMKFKFMMISEIESDTFFIDSIRMNEAVAMLAPPKTLIGTAVMSGISPVNVDRMPKKTASMTNQSDGMVMDAARLSLFTDSFL